MLCTTVGLALQQCQVIADQLPSVQCRTLTSLDEVDHWSSVATWQAALLNVRVVVSTPQVLYDALIHGFIILQDLALIVFDEAHHCTKNHVMNKTMRDFYHPLASTKPNALPHVLGLTATPGKDSKAMEAVERNLNAVCRAPRVRVDELQSHVHRPTLHRIRYAQDAFLASPVLAALSSVIDHYDIEKDPYVRFLRADKRQAQQQALRTVRLTRNTKTLEHLRQLKAAAEDILSQLGRWAVDHYFRISIKRLVKVSRHNTALLSSVENEETVFLRNLLVPILSVPVTPYVDGQTSPKVRSLIEFLLQEASKVNGIVFVQRRATAVILAALLSRDSRIFARYKVAPLVGFAGHTSRRNDVAEIAEAKLQYEILSDFREGSINLMISTSVSEEGIDIAATNMVIRFDPPPNLRAYVQSRGRARKAESKFVMMFPNEDLMDVGKWDSLEEEMEALYKQDMRDIADMIQGEEIVEESNRLLLVESTG